MDSARAIISERAARAALARFHTPEQVAADLTQVGPVALWEQLARADHTGQLSGYDPEDQLIAAQLTAPFIIPGDANWPAALQDLGDVTPLGVWVRGADRLPALLKRAVTVTGNRHTTGPGKQRAALLAGELARAGHTVTATTAYGIDAAAHTGAYIACAPSLAVLPCGLDQCHPADTADMVRHALAEGGAALSAQHPGTPASRHTLRTAAQLLAALARAVVLVEAAIRCPAMETAVIAHLLQRPLFAAQPEDTNDPATAGGADSWPQAAHDPSPPPTPS